MLGSLVLAAIAVVPTSWEGAATLDGREWPIALALSIDGERADARVDLPAIGAYARPFAGTRRDGRLELERTSPNGSVLRIEGHATSESIAGLWKGFGVEAVVRLVPRGVPLPVHGKSPFDSATVT